MPLSKKRNRERMRKARLHGTLCATQVPKPVQPKPTREELRVMVTGMESKAKLVFGDALVRKIDTSLATTYPELDADGNVIHNVT